MSEKKGIVHKVGQRGFGYFKRRIGNEFINKVGRDNMTSSYSAAKNALKPQRVSKSEIEAALNGRYEDGGRERFETLVREKKLDAPALADLMVSHKRNATISLGIAGLTLVLGVVAILSVGIMHSLLYALLTLVVILMFLALSVRHDYARWQIANRRFGGLREYFGARKQATGKTTVPVKPK